jgi:hypothetical protein
MTMHQKVNVLIFLIYAQKRTILRKITLDHSFVFSCLHLLFPNNFIRFLLQYYFSAMGLCLYLPKHLFCFSHHKTHWTMSVDKVTGHIPARVRMLPPRVGGTYQGAFTVGLQKHLSRCFYRSQRCQRSVLEIQPVYIPHTLCASVGHSTRYSLKICRKS